MNVAMNAETSRRVVPSILASTFLRRLWMHSRKFLAGALLVAALGTLGLSQVRAQNMDSNWFPLVKTPAVSGYERELASEIRSRLKDFSPRTDNLGNVIVTIGS